MENKALTKKILQMALPVVGEMSLNTLLQIADTIMISYIIGKSALSAAGYTNQVIYMLIFIFTAFNVGATAMISRAFGEKNRDRMDQIASQTVALSIVIALFIGSFAYIFRTDIFNVFDLTQEVRSLLDAYFTYLVPGFIPMFAVMTFAAIFRGAGDVRTPLKITAASNLINVIGNYILMTGFGPFPEMGIAGAALSTTLSRTFGFFWGLKILCHSTLSPIRIHFRSMLPSVDVYKTLIAISIPSAVEQAFLQIGFVIVAVMVSSLDTNSEAGFRILANIESLSFMPAVGLGIAGASLVGKSLGERNKQEAWAIGVRVSKLGFYWGLFIGSTFFLIPSLILNGFTKEPTMIALCTPVLMLAGFNQPFFNFLLATNGILRGAGETKAVMVINMIRLWVVLVPLTYVMIYFLKMDLIGVFAAETLAFIISSALLYVIFNRKNWLNKEF